MFPIDKTASQPQQTTPPPHLMDPWRPHLAPTGLQGSAINDLLPDITGYPQRFCVPASTCQSQVPSPVWPPYGHHTQKPRWFVLPTNTYPWSWPSGHSFKIWIWPRLWCRQCKVSLSSADPFDIDNKPVCVCVCVCVCVWGSLTLDDGQKDYNDKEEEGDVKDDAVDLILVTRRVFNLVTDPSTGSHTYIHVEHVALGDRARDT